MARTRLAARNVPKKKIDLHPDLTISGSGSSLHSISRLRSRPCGKKKSESLKCNSGSRLRAVKRLKKVDEKYLRSKVKTDLSGNGIDTSDTAAGGSGVFDYKSCIKKLRDEEINSDLPALQVKSSDWATFEPFRTVAGSWTMFNIKLSTCKLEQFWKLVARAANYTGLKKLHSPDDVPSCCDIDQIFRKIKTDFELSKMRAHLKSTRGWWQSVTGYLGKHLDKVDKKKSVPMTILKYIGKGVVYLMGQDVHGVGTPGCAEQERNDNPAEKACTVLANDFISKIFHFSGLSPVYGSYLAPCNGEYQRTKVYSVPDLEYRSSVEIVDKQDQPNELGRFNLLTVEVKGELHTNDPVIVHDHEWAILKDCKGTIHQHLSQLLCTLRTSVFAQDWSNISEKNKTSPADVNHIFGMMLHHTHVQLTCLALTKNHMAKIMRRVRFTKREDDSPDSIKHGSDSEPDDVLYLTSATDDEGVLYMTESFDMKDPREFSALTELVKVLVILGQYQEIVL